MLSHSAKGPEIHERSPARASNALGPHRMHEFLSAYRRPGDDDQSERYAAVQDYLANPGRFRSTYRFQPSAS